MKNMDSELSYDNTLEILYRTSLKTLDTLRCTSNEFDTLTHGSNFLHIYTKRKNMVSGFLVNNIRRNTYISEFVPSPSSTSIDLRFLPLNAKILASSEQGIVVFESRDPKNHRNVFYNVCKPTTKQVSRLPNPQTRCLTEKVAIIVMGSKTKLQYKIVRLSNPKFTAFQHDELYPLNCEVFSSTERTWVRLKPLKLPCGVFLANSQAITARGSINVLLTNGDVLMFDAYKETWTRVSSPVSTLDECQFATPMQLVKYAGMLGIAWKPSNASWEIWVLTHDQSFKKLHVFSKKEYSETVSLQALYDSDTSIMVDHNTLIFHRFKRGENISKFVMSDHPYQIFNFRSDSELVDFGYISGFLASKLRRSTDCISEFVPSPSSPSFDLRFLPLNAKIVASSEQGVVVFESRDPKNHRNVFYNVCKPTTKQVSRLPNPKTRYLTEKVAIIVMGSKTKLRYKIVRLSNPTFTAFQQDDEFYSLNCEVFDSTELAWAQLKALKLPYGVFFN